MSSEYRWDTHTHMRVHVDMHRHAHMQDAASRARRLAAVQHTLRSSSQSFALYAWSLPSPSWPYCGLPAAHTGGVRTGGKTYAAFTHKHMDEGVGGGGLHTHNVCAHVTRTPRRHRGLCCAWRVPPL
jgi:hypothetical protein